MDGALMQGGLSEGQLFDALRQALWAAGIMSALVLIVALVVGLVVGLLQALTSVQEMTLTFVPKLAAMIAVFWVTMAFMTGTLVDLFQGGLMPMVAGADAMENATYATIGRQTGLQAQMRMVANNIANANTTGYRGEGLVFSEVVRSTGEGASLSMATARARVTDLAQGAMSRTGSAFDLAIEGEGFFMVQTPDGDRLTRAGHFGPNEAGDLVTPEGFPVLDAGGAPLIVPTGLGPVGISPDGTVSAGGQPVGQVGLFVPRDPLELKREGGTRFEAASGADPAPTARILQGFLEESNVDPIIEVARMIEVSRAYEMGQNFLEREDQRIRSVVQALTVR